MDEPVAWLFKRENEMPIITDDPDHKDGSWVPLYTAPPKKKWVGLTEDEATILFRLCLGRPYDDFWHAIEAKLKEKNT